MKAEEQKVSRQQEQGVKQATIVLPYFDEEIPVLFLADGTAYLPVRSLCRMLGLRAEIHIPRWQKLVLWANARKLPLRTVRGERLLWCLHRGALPFWCNCFNWSLVSAVRREQLRQATDAWQEDVALAQQLLLEHDRSLRRYLFEFLVVYSDAETWLNQWSLSLFSSLDATSSRQFDLLLSQGKTLISQATAQARKVIQERALAPVFDVVTLDVNGAVKETDTSFPLFPVVPPEDSEQFFASMRKLAQWHQDTKAFIGSFKCSQNSDQSEEA